jgi:predicted O-methyltransferase YrrM
MDSPDRRANAGRWAAERAVSVEEALRSVGLLKRGARLPKLSPVILAEAEALAKRATVEMGGPGDLRLIYAAARLSDARRAVETGVAYGWSSLAMLAALSENGDGRLASVDMPYAKRDNEPFVGIVVPDALRANWTLIRQPDRNGLQHAIARLGGTIDLAHYDSDKTYRGRQFGYPVMWRALRPGGLFISDDIQDNLAFAHFVERARASYGVVESAGKYVGIALKPGLKPAVN